MLLGLPNFVQIKDFRVMIVLEEVVRDATLFSPRELNRAIVKENGLDFVRFSGFRDELDENDNRGRHRL